MYVDDDVDRTTKTATTRDMLEDKIDECNEDEVARTSATRTSKVMSWRKLGLGLYQLLGQSILLQLDTVSEFNVYDRGDAFIDP